MNDEHQHRTALLRARAIKRYWIHALVFAAVMTLLFVIDVSDDKGWWFFWPLGGWGIGVLSHANAVFGLFGFLKPDWRRRQERELVRRSS